MSAFVIPLPTGLERAWSAFEERRAAPASLLKTLAVAFQLGLLVVIIYEFKIESRSFLNLSILTFAGFLVNAVLPRPWRLPFFALLSLAGIWLVLGAANAAWLVGLGLTLIGVCHLPLSWRARVLLLLTAGAGLVVLREGWAFAGAPVPDAIWPVLGSMFMFRIILYLYDLEHAKVEPSAPWILSYFFMLPNVCFPLFPVVDSTKFRTTYYNEDDHRIYQRGITWMFRGLYQLVLYRLVYSSVAMDPNDVAGVAELVQYMLAAFLLYLRVSGYFHLIVGMLLLFGFNLPETHHQYFLASSFTDFWRRINIYWKDFMMKIFYYPTYFKLRRMGGTRALVISTCIVFLMTWLLHAYQWYWILGGLFLEWHDVMFWSILGVAVVVNSVWEQKRGRARSLTRRGWDPLRFGALALRTGATFMVICTLWSLWTADHLAQWIGMWSTAGNAWIWAVLLVAGMWGGSVLLSRAAVRRAARDKVKKVIPSPSPVPPSPQFWRAAVPSTAIILLFAVLGEPQVYGRLGAEPAQRIASLQESRLNTRDTNLLERGYYENLVALNQHNAQLWELYNREPIDWQRLTDTEAWRERQDMLLGELVPETEMVFKRQPMRINSWGFRDREYTREKPPGTYRLAVLGASHVFGSGVADGENFESRLEEMLNAGGEDSPWERYEVLNFGVPNRSALEDIAVLREKVYAFSPDAIIHFAHTHDLNRLSRHVPKIIHASNGELPFEYLRRRFAEIGVGPGTAETVIEVKVRPHSRELLSWAYGQIVSDCRERGVEPIYVLLPRTWERSDRIEGDEDTLLELAREAGFTTVTVTDAYDGHETDDLVVAEWDFHPNPFAHRLLASRIHQELSRATRFVGPGAAGEATRIAGSAVPPTDDHP